MNREDAARELAGLEDAYAADALDPAGVARMEALQRLLDQPAARPVPVPVHQIGLAVDRDALLGRTRSAPEGYLARSWNERRTLRRSDGTEVTI